MWETNANVNKVCSEQILYGIIKATNLNKFDKLLIDSTNHTCIINVYTLSVIHAFFVAICIGLFSPEKSLNAVCVV